MVVPQAAVPTATAAEELPAEPIEQDAWGVDANAFTDAQAASHSDPTPRKRRGEMTEADKRRSKMLMVLGLCLHLSAVGLLIAYVAGVFDSAPPAVTNPDDPKDPPKKTPPKRGDKKKDS